VSAGSHTEPGGYTGAGRENVHYTRRGRIETLEAGLAGLRTAASNPETPGRVTTAAGQFDIADDRSPGEVARVIASLGFDPVWKDWDEALGAVPR